MNKRESFSALLIVGILLPFSVTSYAVDEKTSSTASNNTQYSGEYTRTLRSVSVEDLVERDLATGVYEGSPKVLANPEKYKENYYNTLASNRGEPIPQYTPPPCDQPQPTEFDTEGCRIVESLFTDVKDPVLRQEFKDRVRRGRDVWHKGTFGGQDYFIQLNRH